MAKGYWVVRGDVYDKEQYSKYVESASRIIEKFNGKFFLFCGEQTEFEIEGYERTVVIEFNSYEDALNCYNSNDYQKALETVRISATRLVSIVKGI